MSNLPATLEVLRMKNQNIIERIDDERDTNDGYWLYLRSGWQFEGSHIIHETNVAAMCKTFNNRVSPCSCHICVNSRLEKNHEPSTRNSQRETC